MSSSRLVSYCDMASRDHQAKIPGNSRQTPQSIEEGESAEKRTGDLARLFEACKNGDIDTVQNLIQQRQSSANERDLHGRKSTPLHFAAGFGRRDIVKFLIEKGAHVDSRDEGGLIPLHNSCSFGHVDVVQLLLSNGANPNAQDNWKFSPLHEAAIKGKADVCIVLLQHGADSSLLNTDRKAPIDLANGQAREVLLGTYRQDELLEAAKVGDEQLLMQILTPLNVNCHASDGRRSTPLHLAAGYNRTSIVQLLLKQGADVHAKDKGGLVPLHNACSYGHYEVAELLLKYGASINVTDLWQFTPLQEAASKGRSDVCSLLLAHGANPSIANCHGKTAFNLAPSEEFRKKLDSEYRGYQLLAAAEDGGIILLKKLLSSQLLKFQHHQTLDTLLHKAVLSKSSNRQSIIDALFKRGINLNIGNKENMTPLICAAKKGILEVVEQLVQRGANINHQDINGMTSLHWAVQNEHAQICRYLLSSGANPSIVNNQGQTIYQLKTSDTIQLILKNEPPVSQFEIEQQLLEAARNSDHEILKKICNPQNVNCRDTKGRMSTPLHFAAGYNRVAVVEFLLENGADVHAKDKGGLVPLHNACSYGHYEVAELLVKYKANVNAMDLWKFTPLHEAAAKEKYDICKLLLKNGANVHSKNRDNLTPIDLVKDPKSDLADLLRGEPALLDAAKKGEIERVKKLLTEDNVNCRDEYGRNSTPLHLAAGYNHLDVVEYLLENKADVNAKDKGGLVPLHNASSYGHVDVASLLIRYNSVINATDRWNFTPLHEAAQKGRTQVCSLLIIHGADVYLKNQEGQIPLDLATADDVIALLQDAMMKDIPPTIPSAEKEAKSNIVNKGLTAAGASLLASELVLGDGVDDKKGMVTQQRGGSAGVGDGSDKGFTSYRGGGDAPPPWHNVTVKDILTELELGHLVELFEREQITIDILIEMNGDDLQSIGITAFGVRHRLLKRVRELVQGNNEEYSVGVTTTKPTQGTQLIELSSDDKEFIDTADLMQSTICEHRDDGKAGGVFDSYEILKIERIVNTKVWERYKYRRKEVAESNNNCANELMLFHGSPFVPYIVHNGFDERHAYIGGMFGAGIYFAEHSSKSNQYVYGIGGGNGCPEHKNRSCYTCLRKLLLCRVVLGKPVEQYTAVRIAHAPPGHHSVIGRPSAGGLNYPEYVIYRGEQAYPEYIITFRIKKPSATDSMSSSSSLDMSNNT